MNNNTIIAHFERQASACQNMGSDFTAKLIRQLAVVLDEKTSTGKRIENWQGDAAADALALRLCGALHAIVITNPDDPLNAIYPDGKHDDYDEILKSAITTHDETLVQWLDLPPQTNETGRAAALLPGLVKISNLSNLPIHICEIGASAGLNMQLDAFHYQYGNAQWGDPNSPVKLMPEMKGLMPELNDHLEITSRVGCDLSPIDVLDPKQQLRLKSYIWPDQKFRVERVKGAISLAMKTPPQLLQMDAAEFVEQQLSTRPDNTAFVLMHSVVWQYLPQETQDKIVNSLNQHGAQADASNPIYWLRLEGFGGKEPAASLLLDNWPNPQKIKMANACFHGSWIEFLAY